MNKKEISELKRRFRQDRSNITRIRGCYVNVHGELAATFNESMGMLPVEEQEKYLELLKKSLSGGIGKNLVDIAFSTRQVVDSDEHRLLSTLRNSGLKDEAAVQQLYEKIAASLQLGENYLILLAYDSYDVPFKSSDEVMQDDGGRDVFSYIICSICPVKETKPVLRYDAVERAFHNKGAESVVMAPELGFLFPAFDDRATNLYGALYYTRNAALGYDAFVDSIFHTEPPMAAKAQKETFCGVLADALEDECSVEVVQTVHASLHDMVQVHKEAKLADPLTVTCQELGTVLSDAGVSEKKVASFRVKYEDAFGAEKELPPQNLMDERKLEYKLPDVVVKVNADRKDLVQTRIIGGVKYLLINAEEGVEINGINAEFTE